MKIEEILLSHYHLTDEFFINYTTFKEVSINTPYFCTYA